MWLIDENLDIRLHQVLSKFSIIAHTAKFAGLNGLANGKLLEAAERLGYSTILTRDSLYATDSGFLKGTYPQIAIVVVEYKIPQQQFLEWFENQFRTSPITAVAGNVIVWP